jgi:hypothetical protein
MANRVHDVPAALPTEKPTRTVPLHWYMNAKLYQRLDAARARRYPKDSTHAFAMWLLDKVLTDYEDQEANADEKFDPTKLERTRLFDVATPHRLIVRE